MPSILALLIVLVNIPSAAAVTSATLVGPDLTAQQVKIQGVFDGKISYFDANRELRSDRLGQFIQIRSLPGANADVQEQPTTAVPLDYVELTDGQRLVGKWLAATGDGQTLHWRHPLLGEVELVLDQVRTVVIASQDDEASAPPAQAVADHDVAYLANGDRLAGFVVSVDETGITFQPDGAAEPITLPQQRLRALQLSSPDPTALQPSKSHLVWLTDGSRIRGRQLTMVRDRLTMTPDITSTSATVTAVLANVVRIDLASSVGRLIDLTHLPMTMISGGAVFGLPMEPRIDGPTFRLHAPVAVRFDLPSGAAQFAAAAELAVDDEQDTQAIRWANLDLIIRINGKITARHNISADQPAVNLNVPVTGRTLTIELDPAANGPVMDRLILRNAVIFVAYQSP